MAARTVWCSVLPAFAQPAGQQYTWQVCARDVKINAHRAAHNCRVYRSGIYMTRCGKQLDMEFCHEADPKSARCKRCKEMTP